MRRRRCRAWPLDVRALGSICSPSRRTSSMDPRAWVRSTCAPAHARPGAARELRRRSGTGLRPGTLAVHQIAGFGVACELLQRLQPAEARRLGELGERLWQGLASLGGVHLNGADAPRVPGIVNLSFEGVEGESLFSALAALAVSTGVGLPFGQRRALLRAARPRARCAPRGELAALQPGPLQHRPDIDRAVSEVRAVVGRLRALSPAGAVRPAGGAWPAGAASAGRPAPRLRARGYAFSCLPMATV